MTSPTIKRIVCLANSRKHGGRCIAGKEVMPDARPGPWIRPVSSRENESVSEQERCYPGGDDPEVLDIIEIPLLRPRPKAYQQENWLLNASRRWRKVGHRNRSGLPQLADPDAPLWTNGSSSRSGENDRVPVDVAATHETSLRFIKVDRLTVTVSQPPRPSADSPVLRGHFSYMGDDYCLRITDPRSESGSIDLQYGQYKVGERYLTVSLGEPFDGHTYKLIAAIIKP